jgi:glutamate 5-kinase
LAPRFEPAPQPVSARKRWIAYGLIPEGSLTLDEGAVRAICEQGRSLLPAGITDVSGDFEAGAAVRLCDPSGREVGRGLVNYSAEELRRIKGKKTAEIPYILGYEGVDTAVHRDNLVLLE